jgi:2-hydroxychromene-2-carboxylate isomerase
MTRILRFEFVRPLRSKNAYFGIKRFTKIIQKNHNDTKWHAAVDII